MKYATLSATLLAGAMMLSTSASAQLFGGNNGNTLIGAGIGAGLGGVLGSNLAGTGVQQEGTAIGAVLGGVVGASLANGGSSRYGRSSRYGGYVPAYGYGAAGANFGGGGYPAPAPMPYGTFGGSYASGNSYAGGSSYAYGSGYALPAPMPATQFIPGGNVIQNYTIPHTSYKVYHPAPAPKINYEHIYQPQQVINKRIVHPAPAPKINYEHIYTPQEVVTKQIVHPAPAPKINYEHVYTPQEVITKQVLHPAPAPKINYEHVYETAPTPVVNVLPVPTRTYCYAGSDKRYDSLGRLVSGGSCN